MKELPILFSKPMILAILDRRKSQTRRILNLKNPTGEILDFMHVGHDSETGVGIWEMRDKRGETVYLPAGKGIQTPHFKGRAGAGTIMWAKETVRAEERHSDGQDGVRYLADEEFIPIDPTIDAADAWGDLFNIYGKRGATCPSIFMPRWASRLTLPVTSVRIERLQKCSKDDAIAEGIEKIDYAGTDPQYRGSWAWKDYGDHPHAVAGFREDMPHLSYQSLWNSINKKPGTRWEDNPWVMVYTFETFEMNIEKYKAQLAG